MAQPLNPLPTPSIATRPPSTLFVWGSGTDGQLGLGIDMSERPPLTKPRKNDWFFQRMADDADTFGGGGGGLESIAAGGMFSLWTDEYGSVRFILLHSIVNYSNTVSSDTIHTRQRPISCDYNP